MLEQIGMRSRCSSATLPTYVATSQARAPTQSPAHSLRNYGNSISGHSYSDVQRLVPKWPLTIRTTAGRQGLQRLRISRPARVLCCFALKRFRAKWTPGRVKKTRQIKNLEPVSIQLKRKMIPVRSWHFPDVQT